MPAPAINLDDIRIGQGLGLRAPEAARQRIEKQANGFSDWLGGIIVKSKIILSRVKCSGFYLP